MQRAEPENQRQPVAQPCGDPAPPPEPQERQQKDDTDAARDQAMRPFPPIDGLERVQCHAVIKRAVLRNGLVSFELALPLRLGQRRYDAHDRFPLGDRQAGFGEPRRAADQNDGEHHRGHGIEPNPDRTRLPG